MSSTKCLLLIDGHAVAYRAYYAIRELSTRDGVPTNALYGFIRMTEQLVQHWKPSHVCAVFDGGLAAERIAALPSYKAQREAMPEPLVGQFDLIHEYLRGAGYGYVMEDGREADDLLATIAQKAVDADCDSLIATSDKDMLQLASGRIGIIPPTKSEVRMGPAEVEAKTGVQPSQVAEWLALVGDVADNIPGVPGIGPKTAAQLLTSFGSLDELYARLNEVAREKLAVALREHEEAVWRNLTMTRLQCELPVNPDWDNWQVGRADARMLHAFYQRMEFKSLAKAVASPTLF